MYVQWRLCELFCHLASVTWLLMKSHHHGFWNEINKLSTYLRVYQTDWYWRNGWFYQRRWVVVGLQSSWSEFARLQFRSKSIKKYITKTIKAKIYCQEDKVTFTETRHTPGYTIASLTIHCIKLFWCMDIIPVKDKEETQTNPTVWE